MVKGLRRSISRGQGQKPAAANQRFAFSSQTLSMTGASGDGWGTVVIGDFPEGNIQFLGAVAYVTFTGPTSANLSDTWNGDYSVGTTPTADATLSGTDVNLIASTAVGPAVAEVSPRTRGTGTTAAIFDNTDGSLEVNLNLIVDDADIGANLNITATGEVYITYQVLGDD